MQEMTCENVKITIGKMESGEDVILTFSGGQSILLTGTLGTGRVTCLHNMICTLCSSYSAEEISVILIDGSPCPDFAVFMRNSHPQVRCIAMDTSEEVLSRTLREVYQELKSSHFSSKQTFIFINDCTCLVHSNYTIIKELLSNGKKYGVNVILSTTRSLNMDDEFYDLISNYLVFKSKSTDVESILKNKVGTVYDLCYGEGIIINGDVICRFGVRI